MAIREEKLTLTSNQIKQQSKRIKTIRSQKPLLWLSIPLRIKVKFFILADKVHGGVRAPAQSLPFYLFLSATPHFSLAF